MNASLSRIIFISHSFLHFFLFFFNDTATTEIYTLSLHDALPISSDAIQGSGIFDDIGCGVCHTREMVTLPPDRKSTRLNSSHEWISYAVFCLKKKKKKKKQM